MKSICQVWFVALVLTAKSLHGQQQQLQEVCTPKFFSRAGKTTYRVGVLPIRGDEKAYDELNSTFAKYLTMAVGPKFDPPIQFEMEALPFTVESYHEDNNIDFVFANPTLFSCVESEVGATSLVSLISRRNVNGQTYELNQFGGVIFTMADNDEINSITDIRGKKVSTVSLTGFGGGQVQFRELKKAGLNQFQDPKQILLTENQDRVVNDVLSGRADVGFIRTDQLERSVDERTGLPVDKSLIKILGARKEVTSSGEAFPFVLSTPLYPEWNFASLSHVSDEVVRHVQSSMLNMASYASLVPSLQACADSKNCTDPSCLDDCFETTELPVERNCLLGPEVAMAASEAMAKGRYAGWRSSLSYMEVRNMQQEINFIERDEDSKQWKCARFSSIGDVVRCPPGHFPKSNEEIARGCEDAGLDCFGFNCICSPCVKAFDVDFFPVETTLNLTSTAVGCPKFSICGSVEQAHVVTFHAVDNKKRKDASFSAKVIVGHEHSKSFNMTRTDAGTDRFVYEFSFDATSQSVGFVIVEVYVTDDGETKQIPESPFRLEIFERDCVIEFGSHFEANSGGDCVCESYAMKFGGNCVAIGLWLPILLSIISFAVGVGVYFYVENKKKQADSVWRVKPEELVFDEPPTVLGRGTFGLVLLAEYRGTQVAVKRVLPPKDSIVKNESMFSAAVRRASGSITSSNGNARLQESSRHKEKRRSSRFDFTDNEESASKAARENPQVQRAHHPIPSSISSYNSKGSKSSGFTWGRLRSVDYANLQEGFIKEMRHLSKLRHPCITTVMGAVVNHLEPMLVMEYMRLGSLYDLLHNETIVIEGDTVFPMLRDIAQGLRFLHSADPQIVHGDLKAQNVLVDDKMRAKVADFGLSQKDFLRSSVSGTPQWMSPELLRRETSNTAASDVYAFGVVLYEIFSRKEPYEGENLDQVLRLVSDKDSYKRPPVPSSCPEKVAELMKACWRGEAKERPTAEDIDVALKELGNTEVEPVTLVSTQQKRKLDAAERTKDILLKFFPENVAEALYEGRRVEPESFDSVTVLFSDFVDFSSITSKIPATKVSDLLNRLSNTFDALCEKHSVFKVETVGDALMAVTNLATHQEQDHVAIMARFALDLVNAASSTRVDEENQFKGCVQIRVGIHSGPVVASVVGNKTPRYSVIGDTVNVALHLERTSFGGQIQCSARSAELLKEQSPDFVIISRGMISIKGKNEMESYWLKASRKMY